MPETTWRSVNSAFDVQAAATPSATAIIDGTDHLSYAALNCRANQLAHLLIARGVAPGSHVAVLLDRGIDSIVSLLGVMKAGAAYVPLPPDLPIARIRHIVNETAAPMIVTNAATLAALSDTAPTLALDRDAALLASQPRENPATTASGADRAYIIYTSGSSGLPKGVAITHGSLLNYANAIIELLDATRVPLTFALVSTFGADLGNTAIFPALLSGGTLRIIDRDTALDPAQYAAASAQTPIDVLKITPTHLTALLAGLDPARVLPRRYLICGGETLRWELVQRVRELGECAVINHYGPTETTVGALVFSVGNATSQTLPSSTVPIGKPLHDVGAYVVDDSSNPVAAGLPGELWIGGAGVAEGYVAQPAETAARFVRNPFAVGRVYRTGDRVRTLPSGDIEFLGRINAQVKIRGYRVELGEIETVLQRHPSVRAAAVTVFDDDGGISRLAAYVISDTFDEATLRAHAAESLPEYMVPGIWCTISALPVTPNGKIDRQALPSPIVLQAGPAANGTAFATPTEAKLAEIWANILTRNDIDRHANFFELGGHSLMATVAVARTRTTLGVKLTLRHLFEAPTIAELGIVIDRIAAEQREAELALALTALENLSNEEAKTLLASGDPTKP